MEQKERLIDEIERMQRRIDRLFVEVISASNLLLVRRARAWRPPTDVYETDGCIVVKVEIAGLNENDFTISLSGRTLTIRGVRHDPAVKRSYQQLEINYGYFETEVYLPFAIDKDRIEATYKDGFLTVVLPKIRTKKVPVTKPLTPLSESR